MTPFKHLALWFFSRQIIRLNIVWQQSPLKEQEKQLKTVKQNYSLLNLQFEESTTHDQVTAAKEVKIRIFVTSLKRSFALLVAKSPLLAHKDNQLAPTSYCLAFSGISYQGHHTAGSLGVYFAPDNGSEIHVCCNECNVIHVCSFPCSANFLLHTNYTFF